MPFVTLCFFVWVIGEWILFVRNENGFLSKFDFFFLFLLVLFELKFDVCFCIEGVCGNANELYIMDLVD